MTSTIDRTIPMSSKGVEVRRENVDGSRWYADPTDGGLLASVTTVIGATTSKPWLTAWAAKLAAECAVDQMKAWVGLLEASTTGREAAIDYIKGEAKRRREAAADRGTTVHDVIEAFALDRPLPTLANDEEKAFAEAFFEWLLVWQPVFHMSECAVANPAVGIAGTLDLVVSFPHLNGPLFKAPDGRPLLWMIDAKSGANLDAYMPVQLRAYANMTEVWLPHGVKAKMPTVDRMAVLHVRPGQVKLLDVTSQADTEAWHVFLRMLELLDWKDRQKGRMGTAIYLPDEHGHQPPPLLEDLDGVPALGALAAAGIHRIDQLVDAGPEALLSISGYGPGALLRTRDLLVKHDLLSEDFTALCAQVEAEQAAAYERKRVKWARGHEFTAGMGNDLCVHLGVGNEGWCHLTPADHVDPAFEKKRVKHAQEHAYVPDPDGPADGPCTQPGLRDGVPCGLAGPDHDKPKRKPRTPKAAAPEAAPTTDGEVA